MDFSASSVCLVAAGTAPHGRQLGRWIMAGILSAMLMGVALVLPVKSRRTLRVPLLMMLAWAVATMVWWLPFVTTGLREWCEIVAKVALALASVRIGWMVMVDLALRGGAALGISRISRDMLQAGLYIIATIAAAREAGADARALATTGGLVTAGLTFSLQQTLGDLVAGLLLQAEAPFKVGDWIAYDSDPSHIGRVVEINWRATKIVTDDLVELAVPNSLLSKAAIINYHEPALPARRTVRVTVSYDTPPERMASIAISVTREVDGVLAEPEPSCVLETFADSGVTYGLRYFVRDQARRILIDSAVRVRLWYALRRVGVPIVFPRTDVALVDVHTERSGIAAAERTVREELFLHVDFLRVLPKEERVALAERARTELYATGETVVREGGEGTEMYVIADGELAVYTDQGRREIARIQRGGFFGEMALLTGEPRSATVRAVNPCTVHVIDKRVMQAIFDEHPKMLGVVSEAVATRQDELARTRGESVGEADITSR
ncbi:MAG: cyclic nucleotide-binding domain-containing protein, partial [Deltaproteobacteria bacterium]